MRYAFAGIVLDFPPEWRDVTDDLPVGTPPTLARGDHAMGVLQFTIARYTGGKPPEYDSRVLISLARQFESAHALIPAGTIGGFVNPTFVTFGVFADYSQEGSSRRVWFVSDGEHLAFVTFTGVPGTSCEWARELWEADEMVRSIAF